VQRTGTYTLVPAGLTDHYKERLDEEVHSLIKENAPVGVSNQDLKKDDLPF
jgi:hypothetical protein